MVVNQTIYIKNRTNMTHLIQLKKMSFRFSLTTILIKAKTIVIAPDFNEPQICISIVFQVK